MLENNNIQVVSKQARHRSTNMLRHMSNIMFDFFEDLPTDLHFQSYMLRCYAKA